MDHKIEEIHENIINGNRRDAVKLMDEYGDDFFSEYARYLDEIYGSWEVEYYYFKDAVLSYFRIQRR
jgi:hypothetical protein